MLCIESRDRNIHLNRKAIPSSRVNRRSGSQEIPRLLLKSK